MTDSSDNNENGTEKPADENLNQEPGSEQQEAPQEAQQEEPPVDQMDAMAAAMEEAKKQEAAAAAEANTIEAEVTPARSAEEIARTVSGDDVNIEALLKVPVSLSIEVGRTKMPLNDLLDTQEGAVIELERLLDEPLDILVNGALIAHGVVVLAEDRFGIQVTDIISLEERARSL